MVTIMGSIEATTTTSLVATLPVGYKPAVSSGNQVFITALQSSDVTYQANIYVIPNGSISVLSTTNDSTAIGLNCTFFTD